MIPPSVGAAGIALDELDPRIRPQDDLFLHVNGRWIARTEIPSDKARYGSFLVLAEEAEQAVRDILEGAVEAAPGGEERKLGDLYSCFLDEERADRLGADPIRPLLAQVDALDGTDALLRLLGQLERQGVSGLLQLYVDNDPGDPERYLVFAEQGGLGLPDESYYREEHFAQVRERYLELLERMFGLAGLDDAAGRAGRVMELETELAGSHWDRVRSRDSTATYNLRTWPELLASTGDWAQRWREGLGAPESALRELVVRQPTFVEALAGVIAARPLADWQDWLRWQIIRSAAPYLSSDFVTANFAFYGTALTGTPELRARWKRAVGFVEQAMGEAVGRIYVERHFSPSAKQRMDELVDRLVQAYRDSIRHLPWMTEETKARALQKLEKFTPKIGYPVRWRDYSRLEVHADDLIANVRAVAAFTFDRELGKIGRPIDRDEWFMTPQTVNAYYNPGFNEIVFPAAILQYPFFVDGRDPAANYGAIGAVIGHEIGHGFDDQGSKYDGDGALSNWWSDADREAFEALAARLIAQYDALSPRQLPGHTVNGALTIGENIGDLGGLGIAWKAYLLSLDGAEPPVVEGLTGAQRFFLSWAQAWQARLRDEEALRLLSIDPHAPNEFRCNQIVRNIDAFYAAFGVTPGDALWMEPDDRVVVW